MIFRCPDCDEVLSHDSSNCLLCVKCDCKFQLQISFIKLNDKNNRKLLPAGVNEEVDK